MPPKETARSGPRHEARPQRRLHPVRKLQGGGRRGGGMGGGGMGGGGSSSSSPPSSGHPRVPLLLLKVVVGGALVGSQDVVVAAAALIQPRPLLGILLEHAAALVAEDEVAAAVHRVASGALLDEELALGALPQLLVLRKGREGRLGRVRVATLRLELLAAHPAVPGLAAADEAKGLDAERALELAVVLLPREDKGAARGGARAEAVLRLDAPLQREAIVALDVGGRLEAALDVLRGERHGTSRGLDAGAGEVFTEHLTNLDLLANERGEALHTEVVAA
jgi:hypothetical protein